MSIEIPGDRDADIAIDDVHAFSKEMIAQGESVEISGATVEAAYNRIQYRIEPNEEQVFEAPTGKTEPGFAYVRSAGSGAFFLVQSREGEGQALATFGKGEAPEGSVDSNAVAYKELLDEVRALQQEQTA